MKMWEEKTREIALVLHKEENHFTPPIIEKWWKYVSELLLHIISMECFISEHFWVDLFIYIKAKVSVAKQKIEKYREQNKLCYFIIIISHLESVFFFYFLPRFPLNISQLFYFLQWFPTPPFSIHTKKKNRVNGLSWKERMKELEA